MRVLFSVVITLVFQVLGVDCAGEWRYGRATYYGNEPWYWSIHHGSCGYGYICDNVGTGWDVVALPDVHYEYAGSCGRCYEIKCHPMNFHDGYGQILERSTQCFNTEESTVTTVVDTCPCNYATNAYSNKRWCCGDMDHFDVSVWAFEKLAELKWGVIGLHYRPVPCDYKPQKQAFPRSAPFWGQQPWDFGVQCPRPLEVRNGQNNHQIPRTEINVPWPDNSASVSTTTDTVKATLPEPIEYKQKESTSLFDGGKQGGNWDIQAWDAQAWFAPNTGVHGGQALCGNIQRNGALTFSGKTGQLKDKVAIEFYAKTDNGIPNLAIDLSSEKAGCKPIDLKFVPERYQQNSYTRYKVDLKWFGEGDSDMDVFLVSCNSQSVDDLQYINFKNLGDSEQTICMDQVDLVSDAVMRKQVFNTNPVPTPVPRQQGKGGGSQLQIYGNGVMNGFQINSWNAEAYESPGWGVHDHTAVCAKLYPWGGVSLDGPQGSFYDKKYLEFWVRTDNGIPPVVASISSKNTACKNLPLQDIAKSGRIGWYQRFSVGLAAFDNNEEDWDNFKGCGKGNGLYQINKLSFMNLQNQQVWICFDEVKLSN